MLDPEIGPDLDRRGRPVPPVTEQTGRRARYQALVGQYDACQDVDPDEMTPDGGRHGQTGQGVVAKHTDADTTADLSDDPACHVGHGGDGDRRHPSPVKGPVPEVFQEDRPGAGLREPSGFLDGPVHDGRERTLVEGTSRKRRQMNDGDPPFHRDER